MEARDTVNQFIKLDLEELLRLRIEEIKQQQAEISFKAGQEAAFKEVGTWLKQPCPHGQGAVPYCWIWSYCLMVLHKARCQGRRNDRG